MSIIGYARVSTDDQNLDLQLHALQEAGCERIERDHGISGSTTTRPGLDAALASLQPGDTLVVWKIDRLGRSLGHLVQTVADLGSRGVGFRSLRDPIDTTSASGRLVLHIMCAMAEFERDLIRERTAAGLDAAKRRGARLGRRPSLTPDQTAHAAELVGQGKSGREVARLLRVSHTSVQRALGRLTA